MDQASEHSLNDVDPRLWSLRLREDDLPETDVEEEDKVLSFAPTPRERALEPARDRSPSQKRDWSAAIDLVREASEAIRLSEERATELEGRTQELLQRFREELKSAQARIAASEKRAEEAEGRARDAESRMKDAEQWLERFHDAILDGFTPHLGGAGDRPEERAER
jgi:chromosome segregation ATPase